MLSQCLIRVRQEDAPPRRLVGPAGPAVPSPTPHPARRLLRNRGLHHPQSRGSRELLWRALGLRPTAPSLLPFSFFSLRSTKIRSSEKFPTRRRARVVRAPAPVPPAGPRAPGAVRPAGPSFRPACGRPPRCPRGWAGGRLRILGFTQFFSREPPDAVVSGV